MSYDPTIVAKFKAWISAERGLSPHTLDAYAYDIGLFLAFVQERNVEFTSVAAEAWLKHLETEGYAERSRARMRMSVLQFFGMLVERDAISGDVLMIDPVRVDKENLPVLDPGEVARLLAAVEGPASERDRALLLLMHSTALRVSEICSLNVNSISFEGGYLRVTVKGGNERVVPIEGECLTALRDYTRGWRTRHALLTEPSLFVKLTGTRMKRRYVSMRIARLCEKIRLAHSTSHTLRRSRATEWLNDGASVEEVQKRLGHQSISSTQMYLKLSQKRLMDTARKFHPSWSTPPSE